MIKKPVSVITRSKATDKKKKESYMLQNSQTQRYIVGVNESQWKKHKELLQKLKELVDGGQIKTKKDAKKWIADKLSEGPAN